MLDTMNARRPTTDNIRELPPPFLPCPLCGSRLSQDPIWKSLHWLCPRGHSYSNAHALIAELRDRGWLPPSIALGDLPDAQALNELLHPVPGGNTR